MFHRSKQPVLKDFANEKIFIFINFMHALLDTELIKCKILYRCMLSKRSTYIKVSVTELVRFRVRGLSKMLANLVS